MPYSTDHKTFGVFGQFIKAQFVEATGTPVTGSIYEATGSNYGAEAIMVSGSITRGTVTLYGNDFTNSSTMKLNAFSPGQVYRMAVGQVSCSNGGVYVLYPNSQRYGG